VRKKIFLYIYNKTGVKMKKILFAILVVLLSFAFSANAQPNPPANLQVEITQNFFGPIVKLTWDAPTEHFTKYRIYKKDGAIADSAEFYVRHFGVRHTEFFDHWVQGGNTYSYYVITVDQNGESEASNIVEVLIEEPGISTLTGTITADDSGDPLPETRVKLIPVEQGRMIFTYTDSLGNYSVNAQPGDYFVRFEKWGYWFEFYNDTREFQNAESVTLAEDETLEINAGLEVFTPPAHYTVSGNVSDADGNPVRAAVRVFRVAHNSFHFRNGQTRTDSLGNYSLTLREGDSVAVYVCPVNHDLLSEFYNDKSTFEEADKILVNGDITGIDFVLEAKPILSNGITGIVEDTLGVGVESILKAFRLRTPEGRHNVYSVTSDTNGVYAFGNLIPGEYYVFAKPNGNYMPTFFKYDGTQSMHWRDADSIDVDSTTIVENINFTVLERPEPGEGYICGKVVTSDRVPVEGAYVFAYDEATGVGSYAVSNSRGVYSIDGLTPGNYTVLGDKYLYSNNAVNSVQVDYYTNLSSNQNVVLVADGVTTQEENEIIADGYQLDQNYPNPFNPSTTIKFSLVDAGLVKLSVYNILGQEVAVLVNGNMDSGTHSVSFAASALTSGVYMYKIETANFSQTKKMLLMK